jgi:hypothetical protein
MRFILKINVADESVPSYGAIAQILITSASSLMEEESSFIEEEDHDILDSNGSKIGFWAIEKGFV